MFKHPESAADRLIVAIDTPTIRQARLMISRLAMNGTVKFFKIGLQLQYQDGFSAVLRGLKQQNRRVFLDAKLFDIPETVGAAVTVAAKRGVDFITVHGDRKILQAAVDARRASGIKIIAVTALTSLDNIALVSMGYVVRRQLMVQLRARMAIQSGCDGVVMAATDDIDAVRAEPGGRHLLVITPGVRLPTGHHDSHASVATPHEAIQRGADYIVVGRPIIRATHPDEAAQEFINDMVPAHAARGK